MIDSPEFSEFSFGYVVTEGLTRGLPPIPGMSSRMAPAPQFPTTVEEKILAVDVVLASRGFYYFLQFKRSQVVGADHHRLRESVSGKIGRVPKLSFPFYRVHLIGPGDHDQWRRLCLGETGLAHIPECIVKYAAPCFHTTAELDIVYNTGPHAAFGGRAAIAFISPVSFRLPHRGRHHISYDGISPRVFRFSSPPEDIGNFTTLEEIRSQGKDPRHIFETAGPLRTAMDEWAKQCDLPEVRREIDDETLLGMFGVERKGRADPRFPLRAGSYAADTELHSRAQALRILLDRPVELAPDSPVSTASSLTVITDIYIADQRARQLLGSPLLIG